MKRILVTGGAGFIGSNFIHHMQANFKDVFIVNLDALTYAANQDNLDGVDQSGYTFVKADITDPKRVKQTLRHFAIDTIVHFAAETHVDRSIVSPDVFVRTNVYGTYNLLEAAKQVWLDENKWDMQNCRFCHISTDEVYGTLADGEPAFTELHRYAPNSPYSASKAASDQLVRAYYHTYGLPVVTSNCSNNFGPRQHVEKFIPTVINACRQRQSIPIYGAGKNIRDWLYVLDHCDAISMVLQTGRIGEVYNVGGANELRNIDIAKQICQQFDVLYPQHAPHEELIQFVADRPGHDYRYAIDFSKIHHELGWQPQHKFTQALKNTIAFYLEGQNTSA